MNENNESGIELIAYDNDNKNLDICEKDLVQIRLKLRNCVCLKDNQDHIEGERCQNVEVNIWTIVKKIESEMLHVETNSNIIGYKLIVNDTPIELGNTIEMGILRSHVKQLTKMNKSTILETKNIIRKLLDKLSHSEKLLFNEMTMNDKADYINQLLSANTYGSQIDTNMDHLFQEKDNFNNKINEW